MAMLNNQSVTNLTNCGSHFDPLFTHLDIDQRRSDHQRNDCRGRWLKNWKSVDQKYVQVRKKHQIDIWVHPKNRHRNMYSSSSSFTNFSLRESFFEFILKDHRRKICHDFPIGLSPWFPHDIPMDFLHDFPMLPSSPRKVIHSPSKLTRLSRPTEGIQLLAHLRQNEEIWRWNVEQVDIIVVNGYYNVIKLMDNMLMD